MKLIITVLLFASTLAHAEMCMSHGSCAGELRNGFSCYLVNTGTSETGEATCVKQCFPVKVTRICNIPTGYQIGFCKWEETVGANIPDVPTDCSEAGPLPEFLQ